MKVVNTEWTETVNRLQIRCICGRMFWQRGEVWQTQCPSCRRTESLIMLREQMELNYRREVGE